MASRVVPVVSSLRPGCEMPVKGYDQATTARHVLGLALRVADQGKPKDSGLRHAEDVIASFFFQLRLCVFLLPLQRSCLTAGIPFFLLTFSFLKIISRARLSLFRYKVGVVYHFSFSMIISTCFLCTNILLRRRLETEFQKLFSPLIGTVFSTCIAIRTF